MVPDIVIRVQRVGTVDGPLPRYQTDGAAGMDLHAALAAPVTLAPLGRVRIDTAARDVLASLPQVVRSDRVHALEHAIEVQLPFLQAVLGTDFSLLPLAVGESSACDVAEVIERLWGGDCCR